MSGSQRGNLASFLSECIITIHASVASGLVYCGVLHVEIHLKSTWKIKQVQNATIHIGSAGYQCSMVCTGCLLVSG